MWISLKEHVRRYLKLMRQVIKPGANISRVMAIMDNMVPVDSRSKKLDYNKTVP